ncbi:NUDIX hydrolase [Nocardia brasiliensis]|uniref:NUDIX hydrolase n=1 Tax=Nocardia brasiliensis TaxID=37326 RepID=UPI00366D6BD1
MAAARELLEETGFEAASVEVLGSTWLAAYSAQRFTPVARGCRRAATSVTVSGGASR